MFIKATQLRIGMIFKEENTFYRVLYVQHMTPGNLRAFVQAKFRDINSGTQYERRFSSEDKIEKASLDKREMEYLYQDGDEFHFMDTTTHDQLSMQRTEVGDVDKFLTPGQKAEILFYEDKPMTLELPASVTLKVEQTVPGLKHATATASTKPATMETGLTIQVPQFVEAGDWVRVDTTTGEYIERVKK